MSAIPLGWVVVALDAAAAVCSFWLMAILIRQRRK